MLGLKGTLRKEDNDLLVECKGMIIKYAASVKYLRLKLDQSLIGESTYTGIVLKTIR